MKLKKMVETLSCRKIKRQRYDNETEFINDMFQKVCDEEGIIRNFTIRDTPQQNRVAERMNQALLEKVPCMLSNVGFGKQFWAEAVSHACHIVNRLPASPLGGKNPFYTWRGKPSTYYDSLHMFVCCVLSCEKSDSSGSKGLRLWCLETNKDSLQ